jgi:hypothetical protein
MHPLRRWNPGMLAPARRSGAMRPRDADAGPGVCGDRPLHCTSGAARAARARANLAARAMRLLSLTAAGLSTSSGIGA